MNISDDYLALIIKEMDFAIGKMNESKTPDEMLYYFSACHGVINRVMNFFCDPILVFTHQVLTVTHNALRSRIEAKRSQGEPFLTVPQEMLERLIEYTRELKGALHDKKEPRIYETLSRFSNLAYATSGNGYYLYQKGVLKL